MNRSVTMFAIVTLVPLPLLSFGALFGGFWTVLAFLYMGIFVIAMDELVGFVTKDAPDGAEFPDAIPLAVTLASVHFILLVLAVWALGGGTGLNFAEKILMFLSFGMFFGQVSNSNAHELIHRTRRPLRRLGRWVFISLLFGHHASAHPLVHHLHVGTDRDPNSARAGETFYRFALRAWGGSFREGLKAEGRLRARSHVDPGMHPYAQYIGGALVFMMLALLLAGGAGLAWFLALAFYAQMQLLMSDYVQHYGLRRRVDEAGKAEPVGLRHSWNAAQWFSSYLMLNAPRHSDHHTNPSRIYPALKLPTAEEAPRLPHSLPYMAMVALVPRLWRQEMDPLVKEWSQG